VKVKLRARPELRPGAVAEVCGIRLIETATQEKQFGEPLGTPLYVIEFPDGTSVEVAEPLLEAP
jgi:hypothetical protein